MICHKCGNEVREGAAFCGHCGAKQAAGTNSGTEKKNPEKPEKKKKVKGGMIALVIAVVLASAASIGCALYFTSDAYVSRKNMKLAEEDARSADIYAQEEEYEEAIEILEEGLEKAGDDEESRKILEEKIREVERQENSAAAKKLQEYLEKELEPRYGYADLSTKKRTIGSQDWAWNWTGVRGIACAEIRDWDGDEWDEMLVITLENENILLSMYEVENNVPVKKAEYLEERYSDMIAFDVAYAAVKGGGADYLFFREANYGILSDGRDANMKMFRYDGAHFYMPLAFLSPGGGSAGLMLTAYEYDKNGSLLSEETVYNDIYGQGTAYDSPHFYGRAAELFGKYGLALDAGAVISGEKKMFDDLEASDGYKELLALSMWGVYQDGGAEYHFNDWDSPMLAYQSFLRGERTVRVRKSVWCDNQDPRVELKDRAWFGDQEQVNLNFQELQMRIESDNLMISEDLSEISYAYLDCGGDGVEELAIKFMDRYGAGELVVISCKDEELELLYSNEIWPDRNGISISYYGCVSYYLYNLGGNYLLGMDGINGEGEVHNVYLGEYWGADGIWNNVEEYDKAFDGERYGMSLCTYDIDGSTYYVDVDNDPDPRCRNLISLMQAAGKKFVQEEELEDIIAQSKKELGIPEASAPDLYWNRMWSVSGFEEPILDDTL